MGGAERFALRLARSALQAGQFDEVAFICPSSSVLASTAHGEGFRVVDVTYPEPGGIALLRLPMALWRLRRTLLSERPTTLLANTARAQMYIWLAMAGVRTRPRLVHLVHEQDSARRRSMRWIYKNTGSVLVVGSNAARTYGSCLRRKNISAVNNFLEDEEFGRLSGVPRRTTKEPSKTVLGALGRMIPEKGYAELVDELAAVGAEAWGKLRIAAFVEQPDYDARLRARIRQLELTGRIELLGSVSEPSAFLGEIDVLVVPSTGNEGQPTVIIEALAAGRPVIVRTPMYSEDFTDQPVYAYSSPQELRRALLTAASGSPSADELRRAFGASQALEALSAAERAA
jgi:glycosyltransferase involved in cell wall biosynthesis